MPLPSDHMTLPLVCPTCGWSVDQLRDTGRMGCPACYRVFVVMVAQAAHELHGLSDVITDELANESSGTPATLDPSHPWPTRRARKRSP